MAGTERRRQSSPIGSQKRLLLFRVQEDEPWMMTRNQPCQALLEKSFLHKTTSAEVWSRKEIGRLKGEMRH